MRPGSTGSVGRLCPIQEWAVSAARGGLSGRRLYLHVFSSGPVIVVVCKVVSGIGYWLLLKLVSLSDIFIYFLYL